VSRPWNRRRRLRRTLAALAGLLVAALALGWWLRARSRPQTYRPGESLEGISSRLDRGLPDDAPEPRWTDVTAEAGLAGFRSFAGPRSSQLPEDMGSGAAFGDFDLDGDDDLFLVAAGGSLDLPPGERAPSGLWENLGDGRFRPFAGFPELRILGMAAAWGDADGDGRDDLAVSGYGALRLFLNRGERFEADAAFPSPPGYWSGLAWGDYDRDGDLDLYVCGYVRYREDAGDRDRTSKQFGTEARYTLNPASYEAERNLLLENDGGGRFTDVAERLGVANPGGRSLAAVWHDFDGDGRPDLYVANDISDNALYLQRDDGFEDASHAARVADYRGAMGLAVGDWNRDGDDDLFITHWLAQENALYDSRRAELEAGGESGATPVFMDLSAALGLGQIALPMVGWGTEFADFDGDGWLDLAVANGSTLELDGDPPRLEPQRPFLLWNRHGERFVDLAPAAPALAEPRVGRGLAVADVDRDGDLDLLIVHHDGGAQLLRNDLQSGHWLEVDLRDRPRRGGETASAEGAAAVARAGGVALRRTLVGGASYLSQSSRTLHFGLGDATAVESVEVTWP
ncbi:MAG TPA: CRTAC1 family protein, partial [Thermoanaerobaculia bacterium]|nr:CRTAC1 family protein [Thermoanaerobaculia bacterium]